MRTLATILTALTLVTLTSAAAGTQPASAEPVVKPAPVVSRPVHLTAPDVRATMARPALGRTVQVNYAAPVRLPSGAIDIDATLNEIIARGTQVYSYLIYSRAGYKSQRDLRTLPAFLDAARRRGVTVHVTLTPPASTSTNAHPCSADQLAPYFGRYDDWMRAIGRIARTHRNLTAVVMDDYGYSATNQRGAICRSFSPGALTRWSGVLTAQAHRTLRVMPTLYLRDLVGATAIYPTIQHEAPAVVWPYISIGENAMKDQYRAVRNASTVKPAVYVMVYTRKFRDRVPTPATIRSEVQMARRLGAAGVVLYHEQLT